MHSLGGLGATRQALGRRTGRFVVLTWMAVACGHATRAEPEPSHGGTSGWPPLPPLPTGDSSPNDAGGYISGDADGPQPHSDAGGRGGRLKLPLDGSAPEPPGFVVVDGGTQCEIDPRPPNTWIMQSCCNGQPCHGVCALLDGQTKPVCYCSGVIGGCTLPHHCCQHVGCADVDSCSTW